MKGTPGPARLRMTPETLPLFPLSGALLLPGGQMPLNIFEPRYLAMVDAALSTDRLIGMIQPRDDARAEKPDLYQVGCAGRITSFAETDDGRYLINLTGTRRFLIEEELACDAPYRLARPDWKTFGVDVKEDPSVAEIDRDQLLDALRDYLDTENLEIEWEKAAAASLQALVISLAMGCPFQPNEKQALLEAKSLAEQAACLTALMALAGGGEDEGGATLQ
ncbi:LON peptidase substrate-binding domain-containing protein [Hyphococcus sp.]|uniref:LON peptidase substrate-binding domain-containing protein n=1 Tax=Hyphococcus sp. TaxID=2038636 RepID=UPI002084D8ED|nr:MAG: ATP-dependent protease [Marinicaulis sp.]